MPEVDYVEVGSGQLVVLLHSSVAGARQWRSLQVELEDSYRSVAVNLFGYGSTSGWSGGESQTLGDQAALAEQLIGDGERFSVVGHSFGGAVAMELALRNREHCQSLVLFEPNPFFFLEQEGFDAEYEEAMGLRSIIKQAGETGVWDRAAEVFSDYWNGSGSWGQTPRERREAFISGLQPNFYEWDAVAFGDGTVSEYVMKLPVDTTVVSAPPSRPPIAAIDQLLRREAPHWKYQTVRSGGHMAPLTRPDLVNPIIRNALSKPHA